MSRIFTSWMEAQNPEKMPQTRDNGALATKSQNTHLEKESPLGDAGKNTAAIRQYLKIFLQIQSAKLYPAGLRKSQPLNCELCSTGFLKGSRFPRRQRLGRMFYSARLRG